MYADSAIFSGAESLLCDLVAGLAERDDIELAFAAPSVNTRLVKALGQATGRPPAADVPPQGLPLAAFDLYDPRRIRAVRRAVSTVRADVMLLNLPSAEYGATPLLAATGTSPPVVGLMHISGTMADLGFRLGGVRTKLARRAVSRLDSVLLLSEQAKREYPDQWNPDGTELNVLRMPVPEVEPGDRHAARRALGLPQGATVIGMAARMTIKQKGQDVLVRAAPALLAERPGLKFVIAGDGQDRAEIERMIGSLGVADSFILPGHVSEMGDFLSAIDLIAIPSRFEGLPLVALEALVAGVPGVVSSVDGLRDVWPEEWRVESGDAKGLATRIARLLDMGEPAQQHLVASGRSRMNQVTSTDAPGDVAGFLRRAADDG